MFGGWEICVFFGSEESLLALSCVAILHVQGDNFYSVKPVNFVNVFYFVCGKTNQCDNLNFQSRVKSLFIIFKFIP